jgi:uncharacterized protein YggE
MGLLMSVGAQAQTVVTLSATGSEVVTPDEMDASLTAQSTSASAAVAQADVNRLMAEALRLSETVPGLHATTGQYGVNQIRADPNSSRISYQASQDLRLVMHAASGSAPSAFTALVGQLQQNGLLLNSLEGDLSNSGEQAARKVAVVDAIDQILSEVSAIAAAVHLNVSDIKTLDVDASGGGPIEPMPMGAMALAMAPAPVEAVPDKVSVDVTVNETITLVPCLGPVNMEPGTSSSARASH